MMMIDGCDSNGLVGYGLQPFPHAAFGDGVTPDGGTCDFAYSPGESHHLRSAFLCLELTKRSV